MLRLVCLLQVLLEASYLGSFMRVILIQILSGDYSMRA